MLEVIGRRNVQLVEPSMLLLMHCWCERVKHAEATAACLSWLLLLLFASAGHKNVSVVRKTDTRPSLDGTQPSANDVPLVPGAR